MRKVDLPLPVPDEFYMLTAQVLEELRSPIGQYGPMSGPQEGWECIWSELVDLLDETRADTPDPEKMKTEAVQVAARAMRFVLDVCDKPQEGTNPITVERHSFL